MRKQSLRTSANRYLKMDNRGCFKDKKHRAFIIHKMIDDLFVIGAVPMSWQHLRKCHLEQLIQYWRRRSIKTATIMRYMTVVRKFLHDMTCQLNDIDNKSLGLIRQKKQKRKHTIPADVWRKIDEPLSQIIMALQIQFGLTFGEAIKLDPKLHVQEHHLWLTRDMAFNSEDRVIPLRNDAQLTILSQLVALTDHQSVIQYKGIEAIRLHWRDTLAKHRLPSNKSWRYLYAKLLYQSLNPLLGNYQTCWLIRDEMGIKSRNTLWLYLNE